MVPLRFLSVLLLSTIAHALNVESGSLRAEGLYSPTALNTVTPRLSWRVQSGTRGDAQNAYQIQVASTPGLILTGPDLWDTQKVTSNAISAVYAGKALQSKSMAWWRLRAWDSNGVASPWSAITTFEIGLLNSADWTAQWIANPAYTTGTNALPMFAKPFNIACPVVKGRLYLLGLGQHAASINGKAVADEVLAPGYETFAKRLVYSAYNITKLLAQGSNVLGVELGKGMYDPELPLGDRYYTLLKPPTLLKLISQLEYTCLDGSVNTIVSDGSWVTTTNGPLMESCWFGGEEYDANKEIPNWNAPTGNRSGWVAATVTGAPSTAPLLGTPYPPLVVTHTISATVTKPGPAWIADLGVNIAGWYRITVSGTPGTRVVIHPGERMKSGRSVAWYPFGTNTSTYDAYTIGPSGVGTYTQKFMYHGFRYLQIDGLANQPTVQGLVIRAANDAVGSFSCSNSMFNSIHSIIDRSIQGNMYSVLTDCPTREKLGWLEQDHLVFDPVALGYDVQAYGRQTVHVMADAQESSGFVPSTAPEYVHMYGVYRTDYNWGNTAIMVPYMLYNYYGDTDVLEAYYPMMQGYMNWMSSTSYGWLLTGGLGDWAAYDKNTPPDMTASFAFQQSAAAMATMAAALGKTSDANKYSSLNAHIQTAFHNKYFNTTTLNSYGTNSQAANAIALDMGAVPAQYKSAVLANLVSLVQAFQNRFTVGEIGLPSIVRALQAGGANDVLFDILNGVDAPSFGYQVVNGATSLGENWNGPLAGPHSSLNHFMLGYVDTWLVQTAGVAQTTGSAAWAKIDYKPLVVRSLTYAKSSYRTVRGIASGSWSKSGALFTYDIQVPVGATGTVYLPGTTNVKEGGAAVSGRPGVTSVTVSGDTTIVGVQSGSYSFTVG